MTTCAGDGLSFSEMTEDQKNSIPERIRDWDWAEAFGYAPFAITDVAEVIAAADGEHDSDNWVGVFRLKNGTFGYLTAGCDYTGWDCQAGGDGGIRTTLAEVVTELCGDDDRKRLKISVQAPMGQRVVLVDGKVIQ